MLTTVMTMVSLGISVLRGLIVTQLVTKFTKPLKEPKDSLPCFRSPLLVSALRQTNPVHILIHHVIILFQEVSFFHGYSSSIMQLAFFCLLAYHIFFPCHPTWFDHPDIFGEKYELWNSSLCIPTQFRFILVQMFSSSYSRRQWICDFALNWHSQTANKTWRTDDGTSRPHAGWSRNRNSTPDTGRNSLFTLQ